MFCDVVIDVANSNINQTFEYKIPSYLINVIEVGYRVKVPFGRRTILGFVINIKENSIYDESKVKEIIDVLDLNPILTRECIDLAFYMAKRYFSFYINCLKIMVPQALRVKYLKKVTLLKENEIDTDLLKLFSNNTYLIKQNDINLSRLKKLENLNIIKIEDEFKDKVNKKTKSMITLIDPYKKPSSSKGVLLVEFLKEIKEDVTKELLINDMGFSNSVINTLKTHNIISEYKEEIYREPYIIEEENKNIILNNEQENIYKKISNNLGKNKKYLIHGITGSGKTEIYLKLIEDVINSGKEAIMLVPEISLTPQMNSRFKSRFKDKVAVLHSGLSMGEKYDEWRKILKKEAKIVVGARSAIFAPFENLGIIIIDEEHEQSYIQDTNPKYDVKDIADFRAKYNNAILLLGSATPSVATYNKALNKEYELLTLTKRANNKPLPKSKIIDMTKEIKKGNRSIFSYELKEAIKEKLSKNEQIILFLNKRGYNSFVMCRECGTVLKCPNCDISMTYHKNNNRLKCHYCSYEMVMPNLCPTCDSKYIRYVGGGTEQVEEAIKKEIPGIRVIRVDNDTTRYKNAHEILFTKFKNKEADILVGTQIVAKGLDFKDVSLVGILNADLGLKIPSYDSYEITYNLLEQVSGRAGRDLTSGDVIIQTYDPDNYSIIHAKNHDYLGFYNEEIRIRRIMNNPPFTSRIEILVSSLNKELSFKIITEIKNIISNQLTNSQILGPTEHYIFKMNNSYRYNITIKSKEISLLEECLMSIIENYSNNKDYNISITRK